MGVAAMDAATPAVVVSLKPAVAVPAVVVTEAVTVLTCALVPEVNVVQTWPFDPDVPLVGLTEDNPVPVGLTVK